MLVGSCNFKTYAFLRHYGKKPTLEVLEKIQEIIVISYFESEYFIIEPSKKFLVAPKLNSGHNPLESDFRLFPNSPNIHLLTIGIIV